MYIVTFYSFRGGVGRTTALVNVGFELARRGRKVLLVDFDLESPDLTSFRPLARQEPHPGIVEYVTKYRETGEAPDVKEYLYPVEADGHKDRLWLMPAGRGDADYWAALADIDWQGLYDRQDGFLFFEDTRAQWEQLGPDYVLIDAHAGVTPALGISTRQLADAVVTLCPFGGTAVVATLDILYRLFGVEEASARGRRDRVTTHFVWSGLPSVTELDALLRDPGLKFNNLRPAAGLVQEPATLNENDIAVLSKPDGGAARQYRRLAEVILEGNPRDADGTVLFLRRMRQVYPDPVPGYEPEDTERRLNDIQGVFWDKAEVLLVAAECLAAGRRFRDALFHLDRVLELRPGLAEALYQRALCFYYLGNRGAARNALLDFLRLPDLTGADLLRGARELYAVVPEEFDGMRRLLREQKAVTVWLTLEAARRACGRSRAEEGPNLPDRLRELSPLDRAKLRVLDEIEITPRRNVARLIRERRFDEALRALTPPSGQDLRDLDLEALLHLAMARWARDGALPEDVCRVIRDRDAQLPPEDRRYPVYGQVIALVLWRLGEKEEARKRLEEARQEAARLAIEEPFVRYIGSYWWYTDVSDDQFLRDCDEILSVIGGAPLLPPFMGDPSRRSAAKPEPAA